MKALLIAIIAMIIIVAAGFLLRPMISPSGKSPTVGATSAPSAQPSEEEATAAVRRHKVGFNTYTDATLKLGECSASGPGVSCMAQVVLRPGSAQQNRAIGFARVGNQWEVSLW